MTGIDRDALVEALVEGELARAGQAEPIEGLEERLLARLKTDAVAADTAHAADRPWRLWAWRAGAMTAAAAALLVAAFLLRQSPEPSPVSTASTAPTEGSASVTPREIPAPVASIASQRAREVGPPEAGVVPRRTIARPAPRALEFPSPVPRSEQEMLLALLAAQPAQAVDLVAAQERARELAPIQWQEIAIEPVRVEDPVNEGLRR